jgi:peptidyl-prolyl cis-trans isomerase SurA
MQLSRGVALPDSQKQFCFLLEQLIVQKLMLSQAEIDSLPMEEDRVEAEIENRLRFYQRQAGSISDLEKYLGKSIGEYKAEIRPLMREQMLAKEMQRVITANIKITPKEVSQFYEKIPQDSLPIIPAEVEVAQLLVEPPISDEAKEFAKSQLEALRRRILKGESFEKLARAYSMDGTKNNGGVLPEFGRGEMVPQFERVAYKLKPDSISQVFETGFGFHIVKLIKRKGERVIAAHILIRPENTSDDFSKAMSRIDSAYQLMELSADNWCTAVKRYSSAFPNLGQDYGNRSNCGFFADEMTGLQKLTFDQLPSDIKKELDKLKPGEFTRPTITFTPDGRQVYRMLYLKSFTPPHVANLVQDYSRIQMEADADKKQKAIDAWVDKYRKKTYIRINMRNLECDFIKKWDNG